MSDSNNKLTVPVKLGTATTPSFGLRGKLAAAQAQGTTLDSVGNAKEKIIIVADDSGSMDGLPMQQQKKAIAAFLGVCNPIDTAVGITPMNRERINMTLIHPMILSKTASWPDHGGGGTPMFKALEQALTQTPTRVVLVSDGQPMDGTALDIKSESRMFHNYNYYDNDGKLDLVNFEPNSILKKYQTAKIKIDTVFIGSESDSSATQEMKAIAELTGGMCITFREGESFAKQFKYLAPVYYAQLTAGTIKL